jgi:hypothetical protein
MGSFHHDHCPPPSELGLQSRERQLTDGAMVAHLAPLFASRRVQYVKESTIGRSHPNPDVCRFRCNDADAKDVGWRIKRDDLELRPRMPSGHRESRALRFAGKRLRLSYCLCPAVEGGSRRWVSVPARATAASDEWDEQRQGDTAHLPNSTADIREESRSPRSRGVREPERLRKGGHGRTISSCRAHTQC